MVSVCKRGSLWMLTFLTMGIMVAGVPLTRNGEQGEAMEGAAGVRAAASGEGGGGGDRSAALRFREPGQIYNQEAVLRHLDALGGGHLLRDLDNFGDDRLQRPSRGFDSVVGSTFGGFKRLDPLTGISFGGQKRSGGRMSNAITELLKRNFDEIDRSGFDSFVKRNNFDEIDRYGFDGFVRKRRSGEPSTGEVPISREQQ